MNRFAAVLAASASLALAPALVLAQNITSCAAGQVCMSIDGATGGGARVPLNATPGRAAIAINPADGSVTVRSLNESVQQCTQVSTTPAITSFSAQPSSVTPGSQVTLSWTTSNVPTSGTPCQAISGPSEWTALGVLPSSGSRTIVANGAAATTLTYGLRCTGIDSTQVTQTTQVFLSGGGGGDCSGQNAPPAGYSLFSGQVCGTFPCTGGNFPPSNGLIWINFGAGQSRALQFTATVSPGAPTTGTITTDDWRNLVVPASSGAGVLTISRCPHDYGGNLGACRSGPASINSVTYQIGSSSGLCSLTSGAVYYFNITSGNSTTPGGALGYCSDYACSALSSWRSFEQPRSN